MRFPENDFSTQRMTIRRFAGTQRGFMLVTAVVLIVIASLILAVMVYLSAVGNQSSSNNLNANQAFFIAETGLEQAHRQLASGTACNALTNTNVAIGNGTFSTLGTSYSVTAGVTVVGGITAAASVIPVSTLAGLAPHGRVRINSEEINYGSTSTSAAVCGTPPCLIGARRGMAGTVAAAQGAGAVVQQSLCLIRSTGTVNNTVRVLERTVHPPAIMMVYAKGTADTNIYYRLWDPTVPGWGVEQTATAVGANVKFLVVRFARTRNEAVLVSSDDTPMMRFQAWNGFSWSATTALVNIGGASADRDYRALDVAYETANDRAIVVHDNGVDASPEYNIWNGTTLTANTTTGMSSAGGVSWPRWLDLAPNSGAVSNEIALINLQTNGGANGTRTLRGMIWTGAAWSDMGTGGASWDTPTDANARHATHVAYEQNLGRAVFAWGASAGSLLRYRIWNGVALTANATAFTLGGGTGQWVRLSPRFVSNELMLGAQSSTNRLESSWWSGAAWSASTVHSTTTENVASRNFDVQWEGDLNNLSSAQMVFGVNGGVVNRRRWAGGAWGGATTSGSRTSLAQLFGAYANNRVFAGIYENTASPSDDITEMSFTSPTATWSAPSIIWGGTVIADPVDERVFIQGRRPIFIEQREVFP